MPVTLEIDTVSVSPAMYGALAANATPLRFTTMVRPLDSATPLKPMYVSPTATKRPFMGSVQ